MILNRIEIEGFRGFKTKGIIDFAIPNGKSGSGLTIITGRNNAGKSSVLESIRIRAGHQSPSFSEDTRNNHLQEVEIKYTINGNVETIKSRRKGSSESQILNRTEKSNFFVLPSRRAFAPYFGKNPLERNDYLLNYAMPSQRTSVLTGFESRLFKIQEDEKKLQKFNDIFGEVIGRNPDWAIDMSAQGPYFLKFFNNGSPHSSDGMGEGFISVLSIVDSLYDSQAGDVIAIDEPELSLHPALQKRLAKLIIDYASDRQIIISTHSPYFVDLKSLNNGAELCRVDYLNDGTIIYQISNGAKEAIKCLSEGNLYNPHVFGLEAKELFFQEDGIILTEGQEDVLLLPIVAEQVSAEIHGNFFGWGAGGAGNIKHLCVVLKELGYRKVAGIFDNDKHENAEDLRQQFPEYSFYCIPAKDIRTKAARKSMDQVEGLLDDKRELKEEFREQVQSLFAELALQMKGEA